MTVEYLKQIREQEELAEKIRHDGLMESRRIIEKASEDAADLIKTAQSEAETHYKEIMAKAEAEALDGYNNIIVHAQWECQMLLREANHKLDEAVSIIISKVVDEWQS